MIEEVKKEFGENLKKYRKKAGYTQKDIGEKLEMTLSAVSRWEKGQSLPEFPALYDLCKLLDIEINDLLGKYALKQVINPDEVKKIDIIKEKLKEIIKEIE